MDFYCGFKGIARTPAAAGPTFCALQVRFELNKAPRAPDEGESDRRRSKLVAPKSRPLSQDGSDSVVAPGALEDEAAALDAQALALEEEGQQPEERNMLARANDEMLLRFARARKLKANKAVKMLRRHMEWLRELEMAPADVTQKDLERSLPAGCWRFLGVNDQGQL